MLALVLNLPGVQSLSVLSLLITVETNNGTKEGREKKS